MNAPEFFTTKLNGKCFVRTQYIKGIFGDIGNQISKMIYTNDMTGNQPLSSLYMPIGHLFERTKWFTQCGDGHLARQLETSILQAIEKRGAKRGHKADIEKFDGYSEAWTKASLNVTSIKQILDWVYEDEN